MDRYEIPLVTGAQRFTVDLPGGTFTFRLTYDTAAESGWVLDIGDAGGLPLACGIPFLPGADLLDAYGYLGIGARLTVETPGLPDHVPTYADLGTATKLYAEAI